MRASTKIIQKQETTAVNVPAATEELQFISEDKRLRQIHVIVTYMDADGSVLQLSNFSIQGKNYSLLMSPSPDFAPGKLENEYREVDLWYLIDLISVEEVDGD